MPKQLDSSNIPKHIAIIMDGNGRWAKSKGQDRIYGHLSGVDSVRETLKAAIEFGVKHLTLYAFSAENWSRPQQEIDGLMELLVASIHNELPSLNEQGVKLTTIGDISRLPVSCIESLHEAVLSTVENDSINLILALNYSAREEMVSATKSIVQQVMDGELSVNDINVDTFQQSLYTADMPDPELVIRTSGEHRVSNFLLWQLAYSELHFTPVFWPEFRRVHLLEAIYDYQRRERRFGKTSEQVILEK
ncbi:MAG: isoprenyl transferase [Flavobacteriales bacterium]